MRKEKVVVSIVMPYYKKKKYLQKTLNSILNQSYKKYELIIIYDDENKNDLRFIKKQIKKNKKIKIIINKKNIGAGFSRNKGISYSKGSYIAFLDSDDSWKKNKLSYQLNYMKKNDLDFTHTNYFLVNEKFKIYGNMIAKKEINYDDLMKSCDIGLSTVIAKKKLFLNKKFPNIKTKEDYVLWLKLSRLNTKIHGINKNLAYWCKSKNSLSSSLNQKLLDSFSVYFTYEKKNIIYSIFCVLRLSVYAIFKKINSTY